jgi:Fibronectin type III domain/Glucose / Sorbosone dehydrogenase
VLLATVSHANQQATDDVTLAWDPNKVATSGYRVYVGTESRVYDESFDVGLATTFVFSDGVPGTRYYFAVKAYNASGRESPASEEVSTVVGDEPEYSVNAPSRAASVAPESHGTRVRADALGAVTGLAPLPDGRVLFVENGRRVRLLEARGLITPSSLSTDDADAEFTELVVDPSFGRSAFVFVGTTELRRDGDRDFRVLRYRLVGDALGEGATVVAGLSFSGEHAPRFVVDDVGGIYVAMPGAGDARADVYAGRVLRFAADGSVPPDQRGASPILADSYPIPLDLDWDGRAVWIIGLDADSQPAIGRLLPDAADNEWPRRLRGTDFQTPPGFEVAAFDVTAPSLSDPSGSPAVILDATRRLHRIRARVQDAAREVEAMAWSTDAVPVEVAVGPQGRIHVVVRTSAGSFAVVALTDRQ